MNEFSLTTIHLRFVCEATTPLRLEADIFRAGSNLRGALGQVMLRSYCAHPHQDPKGFLARAAGQDERGENLWGLCPVHWLLAANEKPGEERRGYALVPPLPNGGADGLNRADALRPKDTFEFGITLFGNAQKFLPYFILAAPEMGRAGIGPGRGKFELKRVWALNPLTGESECLFGDAGNVVRTPTLEVNHEMVMRNAKSEMGNRKSEMGNRKSEMGNRKSEMGNRKSEMGNRKSEMGNRKSEMGNRKSEMGNRKSEIENQKSKIEIEFLTPMRLIDRERTVKSPEFAPLFARLLERVDELEEQFGRAEGGKRKADSGEGNAESGRTREEVMRLRELAGRVELCEVNSRWVEVFSGSTRRGMASPLSGFVGRAVFSARREVWAELLPWLLWGELAQVGKAAVKGNGVMRILDF